MFKKNAELDDPRFLPTALICLNIQGKHPIVAQTELTNKRVKSFYLKYKNGPLCISSLPLPTRANDPFG